MKKLTAGIFSILLGMVAVNSADAAVASKGYVDGKVGANTTSIEALTQTVAANKTAAEKLVSDYKTENDAKVAKNTSDITALTGLVEDNADAIAAQTQALATEKTAREDADKAISDKIGTVAEGTTVVEMISDAQTNATYDDTEVLGLISDNASAIETLNGNATVEGSVAKSIADAINELDLANTYDAKGSAEAALEAAKTYADENDADTIYDDTQVKADIATNAAAIASGDAATLQSAKDYANGLATNYDAAGSAAQALADAKAYADAAEADAVATAKTYTDGEIDKLEQTLGATSGDLTALETRVGTAEGEIDALQVVADTVTNAETGLAATRTVAQQGVTDAATAQAAAEAAQTQANKGVADAATAQAAAEAAQATANAAIPAPTGECSNSTYKCVLTYNNSAYTWEVIERGTGEVIE